VETIKFWYTEHSHHPCPNCDVLGGATQANIYRSVADAITAVLIFALHYPSSSVGTDGTVSNRLLDSARKPLDRRLNILQLVSPPAQTVSAPYICTPSLLYRTPRPRSWRKVIRFGKAFSIAFRYPASHFFIRNFPV
jgi:hypothetical protein